MPSVSVNLSDLELAFHYVSSGRPMEHEAYLSTETGAIYWHSDLTDDEPLPDDIDEPGKYLSIPHKNDLGLGKPLALSFAREHLPKDYDEVISIFGRSGAYAKFKHLVEKRNMLDQWYSYETAEQQVAMRQWCEENGITIEG
jgi:hypothetical protein